MCRDGGRDDTKEAGALPLSPVPSLDNRHGNIVLGYTMCVLYNLVWIYIGYIICVLYMEDLFPYLTVFVPYVIGSFAP